MVKWYWFVFLLFLVIVVFTSATNDDDTSTMMDVGQWRVRQQRTRSTKSTSKPTSLKGPRPPPTPSAGSSRQPNSTARQTLTSKGSSIRSPGQSTPRSPNGTKTSVVPSPQWTDTPNVNRMISTKKPDGATWQYLLAGMGVLAGLACAILICAIIFVRFARKPQQYVGPAKRGGPREMESNTTTTTSGPEDTSSARQAGPPTISRSSRDSVSRGKTGTK